MSTLFTISSAPVSTRNLDTGRSAVRCVNAILYCATAFLVAGCSGQYPIEGGHAGSGSEAVDELPDLRFERLADGVWMHTSFKDIPPWGAFPTNGMVVEVGEGDAVLVDTAWDEPRTAAVLDWRVMVISGVRGI
ncbi:hypothetical protein HFP89_04630 [Wenzhouxiangella sp. XN79A]|uniref:hypothetical protein n=1 Tax=Wenzhouxiangella sp. XN79A TaxID=2724193 RepID=UPI00144AB5C0|nr:hypothetical protein [Wenzhouxiangella sp. XN79A]NKI34447.1 hypothetical protein [Wenzhouxiangella sp. XN79A]